MASVYIKRIQDLRDGRFTATVLLDVGAELEFHITVEAVAFREVPELVRQNLAGIFQQLTLAVDRSGSLG